MKLTTYKPALPSLWNDLLSDFLDRDLTSVFGSDSWISSPSVNIKETDEGYVIELAAPGLVKDDFNVELDGNTLTISAQKSQEGQEKNEQFMRREFNYAAFRRSFRLPAEVNVDNIKADYENGVLTLHLPKAEHAKRSKRMIEIG